jgi:hypothetical protein
MCAQPCNFPNCFFQIFAQIFNPNKFMGVSIRRKSVRPAWGIDGCPNLFPNLLAKQGVFNELSDESHTEGKD